jgi:hypothetical protein
VVTPQSKLTAMLSSSAEQWYDVELWEPGNVGNRDQGQLRLGSSIGGDEVSLTCPTKNGFCVVGKLTALVGDHPTDEVVYVGVADSPYDGESVSMAPSYEGLWDNKVSLDPERQFQWAFFNTLFTVYREKTVDDVDNFQIVISGEPK